MNSINQLPTFLALTPLKEFLDSTQRVLFLGEWCQPYKNNFSSEKIDGEILQSDSQETTNSLHAYEYTIEIYEKLLPNLAVWLNQIHSTNYSLKYWRVVIGPFLLWYTQVIYHRLAKLQEAHAQYPQIKTIGLKSTSYFTPLNTREFYMLSSESDAWNHQLFSQILKLKFTEPTESRDFSWENELKQRKAAFGQSVTYKRLTKLKIQLFRWFIKWRAPKVIGLCVCVHEFSRKNLLKLIVSSKFRIMPLTQVEGNEAAAFRENKPNFSIRKGLKNLPANDDFTKLILETLIVNMPLNFIEYYKEEALQSEKSYPYAPGVIVNTGWMQHDQIKFWGAKLAEQGTQIVNLQHGGAYGMAKFFTSELLERQNCDRFISWGWQEDRKTVPAPSILVCERDAERKKQAANPERNLILWVATDAVTYPPFIGSYLGHMTHHYFDWQARFANALAPEIHDQVTMRLRPGSQYHQYVQNLFPNLKIHLPNQRASYFDQLYSAKILISDNFHTTFLYGLAFNIPTLLFWDKTLWEIRDEVKPYFKALTAVGIYHATPESAASMLNKIASDPNDWWFSKEVQDARKVFCDNFAKSSPEWLEEWKNLLLTLKKPELTHLHPAASHHKC